MDGILDAAVQKGFFSARKVSYGAIAWQNE
jgi:hypothetical protein